MKCKNCNTNTGFVNKHFGLKFSNGLLYFSVLHFMCASVENNSFLKAISAVDILGE